jgi:hypothetical protein
MGLEKKYGDGGPVRLVWHYLASNQVRTSTRTPEQLQALRQKTIGLIDRIRVETRFEPRTGPLCRWCEYNDICPASPVRKLPADEAPRRQPDLL